MPKFRKKPVIIEARQATGSPSSNREIINWTRGSRTPAFMDKRVVDDVEAQCLSISTLEGTHWVTPGDWIILGVAGEFYPCKPDIFEKTYEPVSDEGTSNNSYAYARDLRKAADEIERLRDALRHIEKGTHSDRSDQAFARSALACASGPLYEKNFMGERGPS